MRRTGWLLAICAACAGAPIGDATDTDGVRDTAPEIAPATPCPADLPISASTTTGCVQGATYAHGEAFLGVPYAEAPVGERRFAPPTPKAPWESPWIADHLGSPCIQSTGSADGALEAGEGDEDCLFLNVWRPAGTRSGDRRPILFFSHGGGHVNGSGGQASLADDPRLGGEAVVVTHNYRLGPLGFLAHPALADDDGAVGNLGLRDTITALRWVHDNAEALGGDPSQLLIFGESAGGLTTCALYMMPAADGLFSAALVQSAPCDSVSRPLRGDATDAGLDAGEDQAARFVAAVGCDGAEDVPACLRALPAADLIAAIPAREGATGDGESWDPVIDGVTLPAAFADAEAAGVMSTAPLYAGANADEGTILAPSPSSDAAYRLLLRPFAVAAGTTVDALRALWDPADYDGDPGRAFQAFYGDALFLCPTRQVLARLAPGRPTRGYFWEHAHPLAGPLGAYHGVELGYVFGTLDERLAPDEHAISEDARAFWRAAATGGGGWPTSGWLHLAPDGGFDTLEDVRAARCDALAP